MRRWLLGLPLLVVGLLLQLFAAEPQLFAAEKVAASEERLSKSVGYLASDELEGRGPGTKGIDKAADFLAEEFKKLGLRTDWIDGGPFQKFPINLSSELGAKEKNRLTIVGPGGETTLEMGKQFNPLAAGGSNTVEAPLVFAGYGITSKDPEYDDYAGLDVKGKVVVLIRKEPQQEDDKSKFDGKRASRHATFQSKIANASEHGAAAVIFVNDALEIKTKREREEKEWNKTLDEMTDARAKFAETKEPTQEAVAQHFAALTKSAETLAAIGKRLADSADTPLAFNGAGEESSHKKLPIFFCTRKTIADALKLDLDAVEKEIDGDLKPRSKELTGYVAKGETDILHKQAEAKNVIASLEGEGPLADQTIIIGAHYDHLGFGGAGSLAPWTKEIHNGADDNASGTATLLEIAHLLANGPKPKRRIVFMAFSGEERGLLGSAYYCRHPRFPLETTIAMLNLDMVGRLKEDKLIVYGTGTATEFEPLIDKLGAEFSFKLTKHPGGFGPSDHSSFYAKKIPVYHFFTGTHSDYHRPSDDSDKLAIDGMRRIAELTVAATRAIDAQDKPPQYLEVKKVESISSGDPAAGDRPYFGSIPDYGGEEEGVTLTGVQPDSPAAKAGLKGGDVIIKFGESKVTNIEDFMGAMMKFKPGDKVKVGVKRAKELLELETTLEKRK